jgi:hypothetical protein
MQTITLVSLCLLQVNGFMNDGSTPYRIKPLQENFFLDIAEDPAINTPKQILGEVAYKSFIAEYNPNALLLGGEKYNIVERIRELKLLKLTAESGLLEVLEEKGLTLSKFEALLPLADSLGILPFVSKNKDQLLSLAPLVIEPAPALLPLVVSLLRTPPTTLITAGVVLIGLGAFETSDNFLLGSTFLLTGLPALATGGVLSAVTGFLGAPAPIITYKPLTPAKAPISFSLSGFGTSSRPVAQKRRTIATVAKSRLASSPVTVRKSSSPGASNGKRKTIKINTR